LAFPRQLSGGEQQRVAVARALINQPDILLADEPTGNLDPDLSLDVFQLFLELRGRGTTVLVATHDRPLIERFGGRVLILERGALAGDDSRPGPGLDPISVEPEAARLEAPGAAQALRGAGSEASHPSASGAALP
jgi:ABC-type lipoprotein export system ATPase subunit